MPHFANGKAAKLGDLVLCESKYSNHKAIGVIVHITENESCNAQLVVLARLYAGGVVVRGSAEHTDCVSLADCNPLVPDVAAVPA